MVNVYKILQLNTISKAKISKILLKRVFWVVQLMVVIAIFTQGLSLTDGSEESGVNLFPWGECKGEN